MKLIDDIRRDNLALLVKEYRTLSALSNVLERDSSQVSQWLHGSTHSVTGKQRGMRKDSARYVEEKCGKPIGWLDVSHVSLESGVSIVESTPGATGSSSNAVKIKGATQINAVDDSDDIQGLVRIRRVKLKLSAGISGFSIETEVEENTPIFFREDWLKRRGYKKEKLIALPVRGDSMEPGLCENDTVVVNTDDVNPVDGDVFAVNYEGEPVIKRMQRDAGAWWLSSDNPNKQKHPRKECIDGICIVIGRVVHKQSEII
jgi:phage repressor protein C with HTH and peptisase S24 domain